MLSPMLISARAQPVAQLFGALRAGKKPLQQSAQIESGASTNDGQIPRLTVTAGARSYLAQNLPGEASVLSRAHVSQRIHAIQQMMWDFRALSRRRLGRADIKFAVHRN